MVSIAVNEMEAENAVCRKMKLNLVRVMVEEEDFVELQDYDEVVSIENAKKVFPDFESFLKRNRFSAESVKFPLVLIKKEEDKAALAPYADRVHNKWVTLTNLSEEDREKVLAKCSKYDRLNEWSLLSFEETDAACASCPLAWNKGRECLGTFGPATSGLPAIAEKYGCPIIAGAIASCKDRKKFTAEDAKELLRETEVLAPALIEEGKMAAHRYSGPVERLNTVAKCCIKENCGFSFM